MRRGPVASSKSMKRGPVAWVIDLNASPDELLEQAEALEERVQQPGPFSFQAPGNHKGLHVPPRIGSKLSSCPRPLRQRTKLPVVASGLVDIINCPQMLIEVLSHTGICHVGKFATLRKEFRDFFHCDDAWHVMCFVLASQSQLYAPRSYALGWKRLFWDQLWPARKKWFASDILRSDFGIRVGVRFRPPTVDTPADNKIVDPKLFLPLHQRLRLCRAGKLDWQQLLDIEGGNAGLVEALSAQGELPADVIEAILTAQHLKAQAAEARAQAAAAIRSGARRGHDGEETPNPDGQHDASTEEAGTGGSSTADLPALPTMEGASGTGKDASDCNKKEDDQDKDEEDTSRSRQGGNAHVLAVQPSRVMMYVPGQGARPFQYARVMGDTQPQETVYAELGHDMICAMLNGFNACLFCYGQTGSGKTHTLFGPDGCLNDALSSPDQLPPSLGVALRALHEVFEESSGLQQQRGLTVGVTCQYVQIYNEQVTDLLSGANVNIRGPRAELHGAAEVSVKSFAGAIELLQRGQERKHVAETAMNERSSRAHTIFVLNLTQVNKKLGATAKSTLHLVDLAGCEQLKQSKATGMRQREAIGINSSLLVLGKVITALVEGKSHVPYYESMLTQLLRPALGGNSRTTVVVTCSSDKTHGDQTLHALRFGERCQQVVNSAALDTVTSVSDALRTIDEALRTCEEALAKQRERGLTHLPAHQRLREKHMQLQQTRKNLEVQK